MGFRRAAFLDGFWAGEMKGVLLPGCRILLVHDRGMIHAYEDRCPRDGRPLSDGSLEEGVLTCAACGSGYDAGTGWGIGPCTTLLRTLAVDVDAGRVLVDPRRSERRHRPRYALMD